MTTPIGFRQLFTHGNQLLPVDTGTQFSFYTDLDSREALFYTLDIQFSAQGKYCRYVIEKPSRIEERFVGMIYQGLQWCICRQLRSIRLSDDYTIELKLYICERTWRIFESVFKTIFQQARIAPFESSDTLILHCESDAKLESTMKKMQEVLVAGKLDEFVLGFCKPMHISNSSMLTFHVTTEDLFANGSSWTRPELDQFIRSGDLLPQQEEKYNE